MAKTKAQIVEKVARKLGKLAAGQNLEADFKGQLNDTYDQVSDMLDSKGLLAWASSSVPDRFVPHVVAMVARDHIGGIPQGRQQEIIADESRAMVKIASLINGRPMGTRKPRDY
jgi:hypothetical protein